VDKTVIEIYIGRSDGFEKSVKDIFANDKNIGCFIVCVSGKLLYKSHYRNFQQSVGAVGNCFYISIGCIHTGLDFSSSIAGTIVFYAQYGILLAAVLRNGMGYNGAYQGREL